MQINIKDKTNLPLMWNYSTYYYKDFYEKSKNPFQKKILNYKEKNS